MKTLYYFFTLWFGMVRECWEDAKIMNDKSFKQLLSEFDGDLFPSPPQTMFPEHMDRANLILEKSKHTLPPQPSPKSPCDFDHNGECLICDCWESDCAYNRYLNKDYRFESEEELKKIFGKYGK
jgi:hypothetical protein